MQIRGAWLISHGEREPNALLAGIIIDSFGAGWIRVVSLSQRNVHYQREPEGHKHPPKTCTEFSFLYSETLGELVSGSWGHFFLVMVEKAV